MKAYIWTMLIIHGLVAMLTLYTLAQLELPMARQKTRKSEAVGFIVAAFFAMWAAYLLFK